MGRLLMGGGMVEPSAQTVSSDRGESGVSYSLEAMEASDSTDSMNSVLVPSGACSTSAVLRSSHSGMTHLLQ